MNTEDDNPSWFRDLFEQLKRRRVIRVATLYVVVFWPVIQIVDILSPALGLPDSAMRYLVMAFTGGLPVVLIFAWIFDLNREGVVRDTGVDSGTGPALIGSRVELGIIGIMLLVVVGLFYIQLTTEGATRESTIAAGEAQTMEASGPPSIAVLPFDPMSVEEEDRFFADGLTEELLNVLSGVSGLQVAARTSSFAYRGVNKRVQEIGNELGVDVILEGSVRRNNVNNTIRVTAQLIDARTGNHYFSKKFDKELTDIFKIQDEIAASVVEELKVTLLSDEAIESHASASAEAMITYSMGQSEMRKRSEIAMEDAVRLFKRAIDLDENYAEAWVGLADAHTLHASYEWGNEQEHLAEAQRAVDKALSINPNLGKAWASQGLIHLNRFEKDKAHAALEKAIEMNPSYSMAHMWYAQTLDDPDERLARYERAYQIDPKSPVAGFNIAQQYIDRGRDAEAMLVFSKIVEADPTYAPAYRLVARISENRGRIGDAVRQYERAYELDPDPNTALSIAFLHNSMGNFGPAEQWADRAREGLPPEQVLNFAFLDFERLAIQGEYEEAKQVAREMSDPAGEKEAFYLLSAFAAYMAGDWEKAIENWEGSKQFRDDPDDVLSYSEQNLEHARISAAYGYLQTGGTDRGMAMLKEARKRIDTAIRRGSNNSDIWYRLAMVEAMEGNDQLALINLQRAASEGWREFWRPQVDPVFNELMAEKELQTMMAGLETQMNLMREQFAFEESFASAPSDKSSGG